MIDIFEEEEIDQPDDLELQPDILEEYRVCKDCLVSKPLSQFHKNTQGNRNYYYKNCKPCYSIAQNKGKQDSDPFGRLYRPKPNEYYNEYQKEKTFEIMIALGWIFDEATNVWNKPGIKENGKFLNVIPDVKKPHKRKNWSNIPYVYNSLMKNIEQILQYRKDGVSFEDLQDIYQCSHTTIRKVVHDYQYEKTRRTS
jgi:hypothetical protein